MEPSSKLKILKQFLPARRYASAVFAVVACPSVRHTPVLYWNG